jgi:hypothetical protein
MLAGLFKRRLEHEEFRNVVVTWDWIYVQVSNA